MRRMALQRGQESFFLVLVQRFVKDLAKNLSQLTILSANVQQSSPSSDYFQRLLSFLDQFQPLLDESLLSETFKSGQDSLWLRIYRVLSRYLRIAQLQSPDLVQQNCLSLQSELMSLLFPSWTLLGDETEVQILLRLILSHVLTILLTIDRAVESDWSKKLLFAQHLEVVAETVPTALVTEVLDHSVYHLLLTQAQRF